MLLRLLPLRLRVRPIGYGLGVGSGARCCIPPPGPAWVGHMKLSWQSQKKTRRWQNCRGCWCWNSMEPQYCRAGWWTTATSWCWRSRRPAWSQPYGPRSGWNCAHMSRRAGMGMERRLAWCFVVIVVVVVVDNDDVVVVLAADTPRSEPDSTWSNGASAACGKRP